MIGTCCPVAESGFTLVVVVAACPRLDRGMYGVYVVCGGACAGCLGGGGSGPDRGGGGGERGGGEERLGTWRVVLKN